MRSDCITAATIAQPDYQLCLGSALRVLCSFSWLALYGLSSSKDTEIDTPLWNAEHCFILYLVDVMVSILGDIGRNLALQLLLASYVLFHFDTNDSSTGKSISCRWSAPARQSCSSRSVCFCAFGLCLTPRCLDTSWALKRSCSKGVLCWPRDVTVSQMSASKISIFDISSPLLQRSGELKLR